MDKERMSLGLLTAILGARLKRTNLLPVPQPIADQIAYVLKQIDVMKTAGGGDGPDHGH